MATQKIVVYRTCAQCSGTGMQPGGGIPGSPGPFTCTWPGCTDPAAGEIGEYPIGHIYIEPSLVELQTRHDDLLDEHEDTQDKLADILEKCNEILAQLP
jgi:hypothetical protein